MRGQRKATERTWISRSRSDATSASCEPSRSLARTARQALRRKPSHAQPDRARGTARLPLRCCGRLHAPWRCRSPRSLADRKFMELPSCGQHDKGPRITGRYVRFTCPVSFRRPAQGPILRTAACAGGIEKADADSPGTLANLVVSRGTVEIGIEGSGTCSIQVTQFCSRRMSFTVTATPARSKR
jgi:hypothetical protein